MKRCVVLNSHQGKVLFGKWIERTFEAVDYCGARGWKIIASIGMPQWEFLLYSASQLNYSVEIWVPETFDERSEKELVRSFNLDGKKYFVVKLKGTRGRGKTWWSIRDRAIIDSADILVPVSIRPCGRLDALLKHAINQNKPVLNDFRIPFESPSWKIPSLPAPNQINPELTQVNWHYLTHWTHTFYSPWCTETRYDFYHSLLGQKEEYSHSAFMSLVNMFESGVLCATRRKTYGEVSVVSFTELDPVASLELMGWRSGLVRRYWEPYGIAIDKKYLVSLGARPVKYLPREEFVRLAPKEKVFAQPLRSKRHDWSREKEWRVLSALELSSIPEDKFVAITRTYKESRILQTRFGVRTVHIEK